MAKIKTKKAKLTFEQNITNILESHGLSIPDDIRFPLIKDIGFLFETYDGGVTEHWQYIRANWCNVFISVTGRECSFMGAEHKGLREISNELKKRYLDKNPNNIWSAETAVSIHNAYYETVCKLPNVIKNFSASYLFYHFDQHISMIADIQKRQKELSK